MNAIANIRFQVYFVTNGQTKVRVRYTVDNRADRRPCVVIWAQDYSDSLQQLFPGHYQNNTEIQTDYFEHGRVTLFADHPLYGIARARAEANAERNRLHYAKVAAKRAARRAARMGVA